MTEVNADLRVEASERELTEAERERMEASIRRLHEELAEKAAIVNNSNDAIFSKTLDGIITSWNPGAERIYGYTADEIIGRHVSILAPDDRLGELAEAMSRIQRGERVGWMETVRVRKDGARFDAHLSISPVCDVAGNVRGASIIARDITEHKRTQQQLRETQKLESLGLIAGGVAHDFNNLLVGIMGNASLALDSLPPSSPSRPYIERVVDAGRKAAHLTRQMLAYAGKGQFVVERIDLSWLVREIGNLIRTSVPKSVEMRLDLAEDLPCVEGDPGQFQQLIMNLLLNGAEAIGEDRAGVVTVSTRVHEVRETQIPGDCIGSPVSPGTYVLLEVGDDGGGMTEDVRSKIFDPFFTTKFTGRGLGLAATLGIVRSHGGAIVVDSAPGQGSRFTVLIPAAAPAAAPDVVESYEPHAHGAGMVLVADDEEQVRLVSKNALERFGYSVMVVEDGLAAVNAFREHADEICLVLLDLTMPVMGGEEAFRQIRAIRPGARIVVSSGYSQAEAIRRFEPGGAPAFVQKPYTVAQLVGVVNRVLGG
jgi:PAS domain S-box-containing protein